MATNAKGSKNSSLKIKVGNAFVKIAELKEFKIGGGSATIIDVSHLDSVSKEKLSGLKDEGSVTFGFNDIEADPGQIAVDAARNAGVATSFQLVVAGTRQYAFDGLVQTVERTGGVDKAVDLSVGIEITGPIVASTVTP